MTVYPGTIGRTCGFCWYTTVWLLAMYISPLCNVCSMISILYICICTWILSFVDGFIPLPAGDRNRNSAQTRDPSRSSSHGVSSVGRCAWAAERMVPIGNLEGILDLSQITVGVPRQPYSTFRWVVMRVPLYRIGRWPTVPQTCGVLVRTRDLNEEKR